VGVLRYGRFGVSSLLESLLIATLPSTQCVIGKMRQIENVVIPNGVRDLSSIGVASDIGGRETPQAQTAFGMTQQKIYMPNSMSVTIARASV
jgi:hypothetical protein